MAPDPAAAPIAGPLEPEPVGAPAVTPGPEFSCSCSGVFCVALLPEVVVPGGFAFGVAFVVFRVVPGVVPFGLPGFVAVPGATV
jgi:hypothetical protein